VTNIICVFPSQACVCHALIRFASPVFPSSSDPELLDDVIDNSQAIDGENLIKLQLLGIQAMLR
jgi:hypothetical protein